MSLLEQLSVHAWIQQHQIKTETGQPLDFRNHPFLFDPYRDFSPKQVVFKAAQIGFTTLEILKSFWVAKNKGLDIIYTLPTESDVQEFAGGKVNRLIAQNPILQEWVKNKDTVEQKAVGENLIYYRGTWTQKQAIMVSSDLNIYDEVDASKQDVIEQYSTRLQHSPHQWEWYFSHPSAEGTGVDRYWSRSDQKHWFIRCESCNARQYLKWPESIDAVRACYQCTSCHAELSDDVRRRGEWIAKYKGREFSGYWIPLLICPWVSAAQILDYHEHKTEEYFWNKVLGLPYVGGGNKLTKTQLMRNLTDEILTPDRDERVIIGIDTGKRLHYVCGTPKGLFHYGETVAVSSMAEYHTTGPDYREIYDLMDRWPRAIAIVDQGGDLIGSRAFKEKYPGRVFLCAYGEDRKTQELVRWGKKDEDGAVIADRNRMIQLVVDEFSDKRIPIQGKENDWYDYWLHWNNLTRIKEVSEHGDKIRKIWSRSGDDHWAHATVYWRVGMSRFSEVGAVINASSNTEIQESPMIQPNNTVQFDPTTQFFKKPDNDWRKTA
jgi:hypothetical protein